MVIDMNPIADIRAAAVDGERPVFKGIQNKERQLFFRILIWTVVVATAGNDDGQVIGERIVTDGQLRLIPGAKVDIKAPKTS